MKKVISSVLLAMAGGLISLALYSNFFVSSPQVVYTMQPSPPVRYTNNANMSTNSVVNFTNAAEMAVNTVVNVKTRVAQDNFNNSFNYDPFYQFFFGERNDYQQQPAPMTSS